MQTRSKVLAVASLVVALGTTALVRPAAADDGSCSDGQWQAGWEYVYSADCPYGVWDSGIDCEDGVLTAYYQCWYCHPETCAQT